MADAKKVDLSALLSKPADDFKKPVALPAGTYYGLIKSYEYGKSAKKETPYVRYNLTLQNPGEDINPEDLSGIDLGAKKAFVDYYLTDDAEHMVFEFLQKAGIATSGRSKAEVLADGVGLQIMAQVTQRTSDDGERIFNDVKNIRPNA